MQSNNKRIWLVTGGLGYIGAHVVEKMLASGFRIVIVDYAKKKINKRYRHLRSKFKTGLVVLNVDIANVIEMKSIVEQYKPDGVLHLA